LRCNITPVQESFDGLLVLWVTNDDNDKRVFIKRETVAVLNIPGTITLSAVTRPNLDVLRIIDSNSKRSASILHHVNAFIGAVGIIDTVQQTPGFFF